MARTSLPHRKKNKVKHLMALYFQFFMDYNLHGMNLLHALTVKFRNPVRLVNGMFITVILFVVTFYGCQYFCKIG